MREILFRGKDTETGEWRYSMTISKHFYNEIEVFSYYIGASYDTIDAKTLGQYTGLTDKNGKKIFEGDIVRQNFGKRVCDVHLVVSMDSDRGGWYPFACGDGCGCCEIETWSTRYAEVIGNIHDNPELLKGEQ